MTNLEKFRKKFRKIEIKDVEKRQKAKREIVHSANRMSLKRKKSHESFLN